MPVFRSQLSSRDPEFQANKEAMNGLLAELAGKVDTVRLGGGEKAQARHKSRHKLSTVLVAKDRGSRKRTSLRPVLWNGPNINHGITTKSNQPFIQC